VALYERARGLVFFLDDVSSTRSGGQSIAELTLVIEAQRDMSNHLDGGQVSRDLTF
jgi:polysaccharide deacetylase 2 family uncharacterized protein YibQ